MAETGHSGVPLGVSLKPCIAGLNTPPLPCYRPLDSVPALCTRSGFNVSCWPLSILIPSMSQDGRAPPTWQIWGFRAADIHSPSVTVIQTAAEEGLDLRVGGREDTGTLGPGVPLPLSQ